MANIILPMLCEPSLPFDNENYIFEVKWDGERAILFYGKGGIRIQSRKGDDVTFRYPELQTLKFECENAILDGEIVVLVNGKSKFSMIAQRSHLEKQFDIKLRMKAIPVMFMTIDCLMIDGKDTTDFPLLDRKEVQYSTIQESSFLRHSHPIGKGNGKALFEWAKEEELEGIVGKHINSPYLIGRRSPYWRKCKCKKTMELIFDRYTFNPAGIRVENKDKIAVQVAGHNALIVKNEIDTKGEAMIEVEYVEITENGKLRQPTYKGVRL